MIKNIKKERFDLFMLGCRNLKQKMLYQEKSFWSNLDETIVGFIAYDQEDEDYVCAILMRDDIGRFRITDIETSISKEKIAKKILRDKIKNKSKSMSNPTFTQGDEPKKYIDLLDVPQDISEEDLHPHFRSLIQNPAYTPAKKVINELSPWIQPKDRHLEKEFQTSQFDQRLWEIYLWASLKELRFDVEQLEAPDFLCRHGQRKLFTIEATTVAPSTSGILSNIPEEPQDIESLIEYNNGYMAIKFGSSLYSKLNKNYWEIEKASGIPLIIAIADFHRSGVGEIPSMGYSHSALAPYLYGFKPLVVRNDDGSYQVKSTPIDKHEYLDKEIPSGFFNLDKAENISAVLFCNTGTLAKFNRMGVLAGFTSPNYEYIRLGEKYDVSDPVATKGIPQTVNIQSEEYHERWSEELHLFHNPNAIHPLPKYLFSKINQHFSKGNYIESKVHPTWIYSYTSMIELTEN